MVVVVDGVGVVVGVGVVPAAPLACRPTFGTRGAFTGNEVFTRVARTRADWAEVGVEAGVVVVGEESDADDDEDVSAVAATIGSSEPGGGVGGSASWLLAAGTVEVTVVANPAEIPDTARAATTMIGMAAARWPRPGN